MAKGWQSTHAHEQRAEEGTHIVNKFVKAYDTNTMPLTATIGFMAIIASVDQSFQKTFQRELRLV